MNPLRFLKALRGLLGKPVSIRERLALFPTRNLPIRGDIDIHWNPNQVPFIVAEHDLDLSFALGLVHAHLREAQLTFARLISQGRLSEVAGPFTLKLDRLLRQLDLAAAVPTMERELPDETRQWLEAFANGLNAYQTRVTTRPVEMDLLGVPREPFSITDLLTIGRLAGTDVNWLAYLALLPERLGPDWQEIWNRTLQTGAGGAPSFTPEEESLAQLKKLLLASGKHGSNSVVVSGRKAESGAGMIASDAHLGIELPNFWLIAGGHSPSYHFVGLMPPGLPICAMGRTAHLAWGGTNMRAASSDLYDVSSLPSDQITETLETIRVRGFPAATVTRRRSPFGSVLPKSKLFPTRPGERLALRWVGHQPSDELSAFLKAVRATSLKEFRAAFESYGVSSQNLLAVDTRGDIAMLLAVKLPIRHRRRPTDLVLDPQNPANDWHGYLSPSCLPWKHNPPEGYLVSANNKPVDLPTPLGYLWEPSERVERLHHLLGSQAKLGEGVLRELQRDVYSGSAHRLSQGLVSLCRQRGLTDNGPLLPALAAWDGYYRAADPGPLAFELFLYQVVKAARIRRPPKSPLAIEWTRLMGQLLEQLAAMDANDLRSALTKANRRAIRVFKRHRHWGGLHRLKVRHKLAGIPLLGRAFPQVDLPASGSRETLMKTSHHLGDRRLDTFHGAQARHLSTLDDLDNNQFVLLGGQDGWIGSENQLDQIALWEQGCYLRVPMRVETVREEFPHHMRLHSGSSAED